jgi:tetratricopeptide (TPR) repeat protein
MTDKDLVYWYLNRNYILCTSKEDFKLSVISDSSHVKKSDFLISIDKGLEIIEEIFGSFKTDENQNVSILYKEWVSENKKILLDEIHECLANIKNFDNSEDLFQKVISRLASDKYSSGFLEKIVNENYFEKINKPKVDEYLKINGKLLRSDRLINNFVEKLFIFENRYQIDACVDYINDWYRLNIFDDLIEDFLSQLIVMLGQTNWVVKWIGHYEVNYESIKKIFKDESDCMINIAQDKFLDWKSDAILLKSEKLISENIVD